MASSQELVEKRDLADLVQSIRSKYQSLKKSEANFQTKQERFFKPLLKKKTNEEPEDSSENLSEAELALLLSHSDDKTYGATSLRGSWKMGSAPIDFAPSGIRVADKTYPTTKGLISLLTRRDPQNYATSDLNNYIQILKDTKRHLTVDGRRLKLNKGQKFTKIIKNAFPEYSQLPRNVAPKATSTPQKPASSNAADQMASSIHKNITPIKYDDPIDDVGEDDSTLISRSFKKLGNLRSTLENLRGNSSSQSTSQIGSGLFPQKTKVIKPTNGRYKCQYVYWDDVNELVERLYLLSMSQRAGNTSLENEIINIEAELREGGYII